MKEFKANKKAVKEEGRVYTPVYIVDNILDLAKYKGPECIKKHVIDNSCGDGAFLVRIVERYCKELSIQNVPIIEKTRHLETYIHGIEINPEEGTKCIENLNRVAKSFGLSNVKWDILIADSLLVDKYDNLMDYVFGNPPYVRVHNLGSSYSKIKEFKFAQSGMTDLFVVFFEIGIRMLNKTGLLSYISPSSVFNSIAASYLRNYLITNNLLVAVVNLEHFQAFNATTYSTILILDKKNKLKQLDYFKYDGELLQPTFVEKINYNNIFLEKNFYFAEASVLENLKTIFTNTRQNNGLEVKNGFATLADGIFIRDFTGEVEEDLLIPVLKASTGKWFSCLFPYKNGELIKSITLQNFPKAWSYLNSNKDKLIDRSLENIQDWYAFGRSQGIKDVHKVKIALNPVVKTISDFKLNIVESGSGVYSGLYVCGDFNFDTIGKVIRSDNFLNYVKLLGKYKSGGYYTFSSGDLLRYLNYVL